MPTKLPWEMDGGPEVTGKPQNERKPAGVSLPWDENGSKNDINPIQRSSSVPGVPGKITTTSFDNVKPATKTAGLPWEDGGKVSTGGYRYRERPKDDDDEPREINIPESFSDAKRDDRHWLEVTLGALDYAGNISRSTMLHGVAGFKKALNQEIYTSPTEIKDALFGKHRAGLDDGAFEWGDVADYAADIGIDIITDPLTYIPIAGWLAKGGKSAGVAAKAAGVAGKAGVELPVPVLKMAKDYQLFKNMAGPAIGAAYGAGLPGENASMWERAVYSAGGAVAGKGVQKLAPIVAKQGRRFSNKLVDAYYRMSRGPEFGGYTSKREIAIPAMDKVENIANRMRQERFKAFKDLPDNEVLQVIQFEKDYMARLNELRNPKLVALDSEMLINPSGSPKSSVKWKGSEIEEDLVPFRAIKEGEFPFEYQKAMQEHLQRQGKEIPELKIEDATGDYGPGKQFGSRKEEKEFEKMMEESFESSGSNVESSNFDMKIKKDEILTDKQIDNLTSKQEMNEIDRILNHPALVKAHAKADKQRQALSKADQEYVDSVAEVIELFPNAKKPDKYKKLKNIDEYKADLFAEKGKVVDFPVGHKKTNVLINIDHEQKIFDELAKAQKVKGSNARTQAILRVQMKLDRYREKLGLPTETLNDDLYDVVNKLQPKMVDGLPQVRFDLEENKEFWAELGKSFEKGGSGKYLKRSLEMEDDFIIARELAKRVKDPVKRKQAVGLVNTGIKNYLKYRGIKKIREKPLSQYDIPQISDVGQPVKNVNDGLQGNFFVDAMLGEIKKFKSSKGGAKKGSMERDLEEFVDYWDRLEKSPISSTKGSGSKELIKRFRDLTVKHKLENKSFKPDGSVIEKGIFTKIGKSGDSQEYATHLDEYFDFTKREKMDQLAEAVDLWEVGSAEELVRAFSKEMDYFGVGLSEDGWKVLREDVDDYFKFTLGKGKKELTKSEIKELDKKIIEEMDAEEAFKRNEFKDQDVYYDTEDGWQFNDPDVKIKTDDVSLAVDNVKLVDNINNYINIPKEMRSDAIEKIIKDGLMDHLGPGDISQVSKWIMGRIESLPKDMDKNLIKKEMHEDLEVYYGWKKFDETTYGKKKIEQSIEKERDELRHEYMSSGETQETLDAASKEFDDDLRRIEERKRVKINPGYSKKQAEKINAIRKQSPRYMKAFNRITQDVTAQLDSPGEIVSKFKREHTERMATALEQLGLNNLNIVKDLNRQRFNVDTPLIGDIKKMDVHESGKGIVGIKYHTPLGIERKEAEKMARQMDNYFQKAKALKIHQSKVGGGVVGSKEMEDALYHRYSEQWAKKFLNDSEVKALAYMRAVEETRPEHIGFKAAETFVKGADKLQNFMKQSMLMATQSWTVNNYFDNLQKTYLENGIAAAFDVGTLSLFNKEVFRDVWDSYAGKIRRPFATEELAAGVRHGVIDNPTMKAMADDGARKHLYSPKEIEKMEKRGFVGKTVKAYTDLLQATTGQFGSTIEGVARMITFSRHRNLFKKHFGKELTEEQIDKLAAKVSHETFFNYRELSAFNEKVTKRLFPFASFYLKNAPYWGKALFDPQRVGRISRIDKLRKNVGDEPSEHDRSGQTEYIRSNAPRFLGYTDKREKEYTITPSNSMHDFLQMTNLGSLGGQAIEKMTPYLKSPYEMATGEDLFTGGDLYTGEGGKKYLFSRGHKWIFAKHVMEAMGVDFDEKAGEGGVQLDHNGNPYATNDNLVRMDKVLSTMLPHGWLDTLAGSWGKIKEGKESWGEAAVNIFSPMKTVKVSRGLERMMRQKNSESNDYDQLGQKIKEYERQFSH